MTIPLISDTEDETWKKYFTEPELREIRNALSIALEKIPSSLYTYLSSLSQKDIMIMHKDISQQYVHPIENPNVYWAKKTIVDLLDIFLSKKYFPVNSSDIDIVDRIWRSILQAFDQGKIVARKEVMSTNSSEELNSKRRLSSEDEIERQKRGKIPDIIFKYSSYELGAYEAAKDSKEYSNKHFADCALKLPKLLKGMFNKLAVLAPEQVISLKTVGIVTSGYVYRVSCTKAFEYPQSEELIVKMIKPCLETIWISKLTMERNIELITSGSYSSSSVSLQGHQSEGIEQLLTPCFYTTSTTNKKRKPDEGDSSTISD